MGNKYKFTYSLQYLLTFFIYTYQKWIVEYNTHRLQKKKKLVLQCMIYTKTSKQLFFLRFWISYSSQFMPLILVL